MNEIEKTFIFISILILFIGIPTLFLCGKCHCHCKKKNDYVEL
jgi:hypothetical protein